MKIYFRIVIKTYHAMNIVKPSAFGFLCGIRDSFLGVGVVVNIDDEQANNDRPSVRYINRDSRNEKKYVRY